MKFSGLAKFIRKNKKGLKEDVNGKKILYLNMVKKEDFVIPVARNREAFNQLKRSAASLPTGMVGLSKRKSVSGSPKKILKKQLSI